MPQARNLSESAGNLQARWQKLAPRDAVGPSSPFPGFNARMDWEFFHQALSPTDGWGARERLTSARANAMYRCADRKSPSSSRIANPAGKATFLRMAELKKKPIPSFTTDASLGGIPSGAGFKQDEILSREALDSLSTLQLIDLIVGKLPPRHSALLDFVYLRERITE